MRQFADGSLRLSLGELFSISLHHLRSDLYDTAHHDLSDCGRSLPLTGYTEWVSDLYPSLTVGWDCYFNSYQLEPRWVRAGLPRTNLVLVSEVNLEHRCAHSIRALASVIDSMDWHMEMNSCITNRYR
jgi:hypothetical protein